MKNKTKVLIMLVVTLLAIPLIGATKVNAATEVTEEYLQNMLNILPNEIYVDLKESEYEKAGDIVEQKVKEIWKSNNIDTTGMQITINASSVLKSKEMFHKCSVNIYANNISKYRDDIVIKYSNTDKYNQEDEKTVKNLEIESPHYYEVDITSKDLDNIDVVLLNAEKYYSSLAKDSSISIKTWAGAGDRDGFNNETSEGGTYIAIFKNNILYDIRCMSYEYTVPVITVPNTVSDTDLNNYTIDVLKKYFTNLKEIISINKGAIISPMYNSKPVYKATIIDGYTVKADFGDGMQESYIIIRREPVQSSVNVSDKDTNVKLESSTDIVPADTQLVVEKLTTGNVYSIVEKSLGTGVSKFVLYDITLKQNNVNIQPNGKVKISIPVPAGYDTSKIVVYRIAEDGTKTEYAITINNGYITFETDHFSNYVVAQKGTNTQISNQGELDDTPKTGAIDIIYYVLPIAIISATGIIVLRRKETK